MLELAPMNVATMTKTPTALMNAMLAIATLITQPGMIPGPALANWVPALRIRSLSLGTLRVPLAPALPFT
jgi:hypothetical protein